MTEIQNCTLQFDKKIAEKSLRRFFSQIIMGSPLNNNVSKGRSVILGKKDSKQIFKYIS